LNFSEKRYRYSSLEKNRKAKIESRIDGFKERGFKDKQKVLDDFKAAAKLGHNVAQMFLKKKNIE